jgi:hypothetical protein
MSRDDRRIIFARLNDVYVNERTGYSEQWTDKRVAEDLGVPRAWVSEVRDRDFGPDHNAEFTEQVGVAKEVIAQVKLLHAEGLALRQRHDDETKAFNVKLAPVLTLMEKMERTVAAIEKAKS